MTATDCKTPQISGWDVGGCCQIVCGLHGHLFLRKPHNLQNTSYIGVPDVQVQAVVRQRLRFQRSFIIWSGGGDKPVLFKM